MTNAVARMSSNSTMQPSNSLCHTGQTRSICPNCPTANPVLTSVRNWVHCMGVEYPLGYKYIKKLIAIKKCLKFSITKLHQQFY